MTQACQYTPTPEERAVVEAVFDDPIAVKIVLRQISQQPCGERNAQGQPLLSANGKAHIDSIPNTRFVRIYDPSESEWIRVPVKVVAYQLWRCPQRRLAEKYGQWCSMYRGWDNQGNPLHSQMSVTTEELLEFVLNHTKYCAQCHNRFWIAKSEWDLKQYNRHRWFSMEWWKDRATDQVVGFVGLVVLDRMWRGR